MPDVPLQVSLGTIGANMQYEQIKQETSLQETLEKIFGLRGKNTTSLAPEDEIIIKRLIAIEEMQIVAAPCLCIEESKVSRTLLRELPEKHLASYEIQLHLVLYGAKQNPFYGIRAGRLIYWYPVVSNNAKNFLPNLEPLKIHHIQTADQKGPLTRLYQEIKTFDRGELFKESIFLRETLDNWIRGAWHSLGVLGQTFVLFS